ncbi:SDR family oxidoreductase [Archangium sp.]|jgi:NAD(P)-dependent dehydrogenase (short-subunit alcohol dehydrogenase family)|uniref:SDR family oxidoreductase n=1 Tax=Archangium sp. TaxID=1872627 RepID=UPI002ED9AE3D
MSSSAKSMEGKVCLVTGATSGLGKATATALAGLGATVILGCRDRAKGEAVKSEISAKTGNASLDLFQADLSSQKSIRQGAEDVLSRHARLHVLVNQAGLYVSQRQVTVDGLEMMFAVNHLAYFSLTHHLLPALKAAGSARVVNGSGGAEAAGNIHFDDLQGEKKWSAFRALAQSKLGNFLFTYELARRLEGTGVTTNVMHPGGVKTELGKGAGGPFGLALRLMRPFMDTPEKGAETLVYLASAPELAGVNGGYYVKNKPAKSSARSRDKELAARLWKVSAELAGLPA